MDDSIHECIKFTFPIMKQKFFSAIELVVLDSEKTGEGITILGYYRWGDKSVNLWIFEDPISPEQLSDTSLFISLFKNPKIKVAIYNISHEVELFNLDIQNCIEIMPYHRCPKERFIKVESLTVGRGGELPLWNRNNIKTWVKHNISCLVKEIIILSLNIATEPVFLQKIDFMLKKKGLRGE